MTNVPIDFDLDEIKSKDDYNKDQLKALFTKLQMKSILDKLSNGKSNIVGHIVETERFLLTYIKPWQKFTFNEVK